MKALIVADLHYSLRQYDWLMRVAGGYDLVIVAGDLLDVAGHADLDTQIVVVTKYLARLSATTRLVVCSGNHDADERGAADESVVGWLRDVRSDGGHVDGEHVDLPFGRITICPWWDGPVVRDALEDFLPSGTARRRPLDLDSPRAAEPQHGQLDWPQARRRRLPQRADRALSARSGHQRARP